MSADEAKPQPAPVQSFNFESKVFGMPEARFVLAHDGQPTLRMIVGTMQASLPLNTVVSSFQISDPDKELLNVVAKSLKYVKEIRPGDSIPSEILDGSASWAIDERHNDVARKRLTVQLVGWFTGEAVETLDVEQLAKLADDPKVTARVNEAFQKAATSIGTDKDGVLQRIETLVRELGYIEALRERFIRVRRVDQTMGALSTYFHGDTTTLESIQRIRALMRKPLTRFQTVFDEVDAMTGEVLSALKNVGAQIDFIRKCRDELWDHYMSWEPILEEMQGLELERNPACANFIRKVYQLAATRYPQGVSWR
ncbi:MAG: hypothetical protein L6R19_24335 [Alphaproteobacteria bacterium]|nr:hypothetical protein [Alphaproteobacteria bacterium]